MFKIGDFSKIAQVSIRLLRYYDEIGLLKPAHIDAESSYRYYTVEQLPQLNRILALKELGLSLDQIARMIAADVSSEEIRGMLLLKRAQIEQAINAEAARLMRVEARLAAAEGSSPALDVIVKTLPAQPFLAVREIVAQNMMGQTFTEIFQAKHEHGIKTVYPCTAVFFDSAYDTDAVEWLVGFPLEADEAHTLPLTEDRQMTVTELPAVAQMASVVYQGRWLGLHQPYSALGVWAQQHGYQIVGAAREVFLRIFPPQMGNPADYITEVQFPVEKILPT